MSFGLVCVGVGLVVVGGGGWGGCGGPGVGGVVIGVVCGEEVEMAVGVWRVFVGVGEGGGL